MNKKWECYNIDDNKVEELVEQKHISNLLASILVNRGITEEKELEVFLNPTRKDFYDPFLLPDMEIAVDRIIKAVNNKEKIKRILKHMFFLNLSIVILLIPS